MAEIKSVIKRTGVMVPFNAERITNAIYRAAVEVGGRDRQTARQLSEQVVSLLQVNPDPGYVPHIEEIQDLVEKVLIENGHAKVAKAYILYRNERAQHRQNQAAEGTRPSENIPWAKLWQVLDWAVSHNLHTVEALNKRIDEGELSQIVTECEAAYSVDVESAANQIIVKKDLARMVIISGPSSSGKTTTTIKISERLKRAGLKLVTLNVDNYFFDLEMHPRDEFGDYDFETPQALDLELINAHLKKLVAGEEVLIPFYNFKTGKREQKETRLRLNPGEMLLIDSLHGLYPAMTEGIDEGQKYKVYLEPLLQMKGMDGKYVQWTDIRLMRRMLRDSIHRAYDPQQTLEHWHYVRSSELRNIIPNFSSANSIINSAMPYELAIYANRLGEDFRKWEEKYRDDPLHEDAYQRAERVARLLAFINGVADDSLIPSDSVIREFIGGSSFNY